MQLPLLLLGFFASHPLDLILHSLILQIGKNIWCFRVSTFTEMRKVCLWYSLILSVKYIFIIFFDILQRCIFIKLQTIYIELRTILMWKEIYPASILETLLGNMVFPSAEATGKLTAISLKWEFPWERLSADNILGISRSPGNLLQWQEKFRRTIGHKPARDFRLDRLAQYFLHEWLLTLIRRRACEILAMETALAYISDRSLFWLISR